MADESDTSLGVLKARAGVIAAVRRFLDSRGVLEVETPALSYAGNPDPATESLSVHSRRANEPPRFLHTSPEFPMKRLIAGGSGDIYQICRVFRDDQVGRWHQPEFTLLEWYRVGWNEIDLMSETADLIESTIEEHRRLGARRQLRYRDVFADTVGCPPDDASTIIDALGRKRVDVPTDLDLGELLDLAMVTVVMPSLAQCDGVVLIHDYPECQAALAKINAGEPPTAARFEAFVNGVELANGYAELTEPLEQRRRFESENSRRQARRQPPMPIDEDFIAALEKGLPNCAGVAVGIDRLVATALRIDGVAPVIALADR